VDIINVICNFLHFVPDPDTRLQAVKRIIHLWRDPDSETRICSIGSVEVENWHLIGLPCTHLHFCDSTWPPVASTRSFSALQMSLFKSHCLQVHCSCRNMSTILTRTTFSAYPKIMNEISTLISTSQYTQKEQLNDLLKWYFQHIKDRKQTPSAPSA
jgi:hypothetical protein